MKHLRMFALVSLAGLAVGCSSHNGSMPGSDAQQLNPHATITPAKPPVLTANTRFAAGQLAESQNANDAAIEQYKAALKLDPKHLPSLYALGVLDTKLHHFDDAISIWKRYVEAAGQTPDAYANLGFCYNLAGDDKAAKAAYEAGLQKDPGSPSCRANFGLLLARQGHIKEAIAMWQPVMTDAQIHYNLAGVYDVQGRTADAKAEYQKALHLDPHMDDAKSRLAQLDLTK